MPKLVNVYRTVMICYALTRATQGLYQLGSESTSVIKDHIKQ